MNYKSRHKKKLFLVDDDIVDDPMFQMSKRNMYRLPMESRLDEYKNQRFKVKKIVIL